MTADARVRATDEAEGRFAARGRLVGVLIAIMIGIQAVRSFVTPDTDARLILTFAFIPASFARLIAPSAVGDAAAALVGHSDASTSDIALLLGAPGLRWWTVLTYAFLHGGWTHVLVNCVWFAAFGSAVARRFGGTRFLAFFALTAIGGVAAHCVTHALDFAPLVGASAAISGMMAAAARFAFAPGAPLGVQARRGTLLAYQGPSLPLRYVLREPRVAAFLATWLAANLLFGAFAAPMGIEDATIAWEAHIGGFVTGLLFFRVFDPAPAVSAHSFDAVP